LRHRRDFDLALIRSAPEYLQALSNEHVQAVIVLVDGMFFWERKRIANSPRSDPQCQLSDLARRLLSIVQAEQVVNAAA
jgi:hypothetical protein